MLKVSGEQWQAAADAAADVPAMLSALDEFAAMPENKPNVRDRSMADNVISILEQAGPEAKIALWAHNAHVFHKPDSDQELSDW